MERRRFAFGILMVAAVAVSQCGSTQFSQSTQTQYGDSVDSPLFMTWSSTLLNVVLAAPAAVPLATGGTAEVRRQFCGGTFGLPLRSFLSRIFIFYVLWLAANYSYQRALKHISAALVTALFSTAPAFVAVGSLFVLGRPLRAMGWAAVVCTVAGSTLVAEPWEGSAQHKSLFGGVTLSLLAALAAATYKVLFKYVFDDPPPRVVGVILMWIGCYAATLGSGILAAVLGSGAESVRWGDVPWGTLLLGNTLGLCFNFFIGWGIAYTYPLFIALGTVLNVPLNIAADRVWRDKLPSRWQGIGIACISFGFVLLLLCDWLEGRGGPGGAAALAGSDDDDDYSCNKVAPDDSAPAPAEHDSYAVAADA
eukprot:TRINITY_DN16439_c0_g1_i1.p1 TRINITY_DN16439_c0_g1~~TRINITY_DN16439_c0_g1_i1.p1  ORF type:complete len:402 (+),score=104.23 TRINITY_DN16439_c0_g1_i1:114-1208(+)